MVQQVNEGGMPQIPYVVIKPAKIVLQCTKLGDSSSASPLVEVLHDPSFDLDIFKRITKNPTDCEEVSFKRTEQIRRNDRFQEISVRY